VNYYLLIYDLVDDYLERRGEYRPEHLKLAKAAVERGELRLGGAFADPSDSAVLCFRGESEAVAEAFAGADPYVKAGIVKSWEVRKWTVVIGADLEPGG
jgi:uncharacterized protein YciI